MNILFILFFALHLVGCQTTSRNPVDYVNPFIGTAHRGTVHIDTYGATYPGAVVPWGMVSVSPHTSLQSFSGYIHGESHLYGFGHVHMSGVGCPGLGNVVLIPTIGEIKVGMERYRSSFANEQASPGYYKVDLTSYDITAEMTATIRTGISKYTFPVCDGNANILLDASFNLSEEGERYGRVKIISNTEIEGWSLSGHFCGAAATQKVYFVVKFSKPSTSFGTWLDGQFSEAVEQSGENVGAFFRFNTSEREAVLVKVGISYVSIANARLNLETEQPGWDFETIRASSKQAWNRQLSRIDIKGGTEEQKSIFYSGLYHTLIHPNVFNDVNGEYPTMGHAEIKKAQNYVRYTVFSLWDTYRTVHPFLALVYPERQLDMVKSMVEMYRENGWLPKWELASNETFIMVGDPAVPVIVDTYMKGFTDFDIQTAYEAMLKSANLRTGKNLIRPGTLSYLKYGYIPMDDTGGDDVWGPVSTTLEYNYADWCLAQLAKRLGYVTDYQMLMKRALFYKNLYDPSTGFLRPRNADGSWYEPFDPDVKPVGIQTPGYVEGNAWHYTFFVNHDVEGLMTLMGGRQKFSAKLQQCFEEDQFVLWNEPDMAYPYLFTYVEGDEWQTQKYVRDTMQRHFGAGPDGLPGNDDTGTISAWFVFSAMGFYPYCPGSNQYQLGSPIFKEVTIHLNSLFYSGKQFVIRAQRVSDKNRYIQSVILNGQPYDLFFLQHGDIVKGGTLILEMGSNPRH